VSDFQIFPLYAWSGNGGKDFRVLILGGNTEVDHAEPIELVDLKPFIYESAEERVVALLNNYYRGKLRDPMYACMVTYGDANVALVKNYCDLEPSPENIIVLNLSKLATLQ